MKNEKLKMALTKFNEFSDVEPLEGEIIGAVKGGVNTARICIFKCDSKCGTNCGTNGVQEAEDQIAV